MSDDNSKKRLGRGLAALIGEMDQPLDLDRKPASHADQLAPIEFIDRNPNNPRRQFDESDLDDLSRSINQHGIVQPVVVRPLAQVDSKLSLAKDAGGPHKGPDLSRYRFLSEMLMTARRWK